MLKLLFIFVILICTELAYLKIAKATNIKDTPNDRSAHSKPTIRGGGIIAIISIIIYFIFYQPNTTEFYFFFSGVFLVSLISFIDDIVMLSSKIRIITHLIAFSLVFYSLNLFDIANSYDAITLVLLFIFSIGFLNIYNFMDGINGITFLNALVSYTTLYVINEYYVNFIDSQLLIILVLGIIVFGFFNFRKKAICFAGDIGSITLGFSLIYFVTKIYLETKNLSVFLILTVYLIDGGWTIVERLIRKENVFNAHKRHLYQLAANDLKIPHLKISSFYFIIQLFINLILVLYLFKSDYRVLFMFAIFLFFSLLYAVVKRKTLQKLGSK